MDKLGSLEYGSWPTVFYCWWRWRPGVTESQNSDTNVRSVRANPDAKPWARTTP